MMLDRTRQPLILPFESFCVVPPKCKSLSNGIELNIFDNQQLDLIHVGFRIKTGNFPDTPKFVATTCYSILKESHPTLTADEVVERLDFWGVAFEVTVGIEHVWMKLKIPKSKFREALPFITEIFAAPSFKEKDLQLFKEKHIRQFEYNSQKVGYRSVQLLYHAFFGDSLTIGKILKVSDIEAITINQLNDFYQKTFTSRNIRVFVTGNVDDDLLADIESCLEEIPDKKLESGLPIRLVSALPDNIAEHWPNALQTSLRISRPLFAYISPDRRDFRILSVLLGGYFGSRLMQNLREDLGCTYGVNCQSVYYGDFSLFSIESEVNNDKVELTIEACFKEMKLLRAELVSNNELETVKQYLLGILLRKMDGTVSYMDSYAYWSDFDLTEQEFYDQISAIQNITSERIKQLADNYLQENKFFTITVGK